MRRSKLKFKATVICPKCGKTLVTESAYRDYPLQCLNCDEDFYFMEVNGDEYNTSVFLPLDKEDPCLTFGCIIDEDAEFTADALEDTLHRLIDEGASRYKIYELTRMIHEDGNEALINQDDAIPVDLGYYITGNITLI